MLKLLIFPYNGNALEALDCIQEQFQFIGFIDDTLEKQGTTEHGYQVFDRSIIDKVTDTKILAVPGSPISFLHRKKNIDSLNIGRERMTNLIHPTATIGKNVKLGINCLIMAGVVITSNATIGDNVCILPNTVIHHDSHIGDYTLLGSGIIIAGGTCIGKNCYIGSGTNVINGIQVGDNTLIGLGSTVIRSLPGNSKYAGNPARPFKINEESTG